MNPRKFFLGRASAFFVLLFIALLVSGIVSLKDAIQNRGGKVPVTNPVTNPTQIVDDYKDTTFTIDGERVKLIDGLAETPAAPGSASKIRTKYFGNDLRTDLNNDGQEDIVFLLTQETGGSGIFYYVVAALNTENGYIGSDAVLLGDRIAPQTIEKGTGKIIIVNYADRKIGEPFTVAPSIGKTKWLLLDIATMQFGEVEPNFSGEADPNRMTLDMKKWTWIVTTYRNGPEVRPVKEKAFVITFGANKEFGATTDCNSMGGKYLVNGKVISFSDMVATEMACGNSQESVFAAMLDKTKGYYFNGRGELVLELRDKGGLMIFK